MNATIVKILPGFASTTIGKASYSSQWAIYIKGLPDGVNSTIYEPGDLNSTRYDVSILTEGGDADTADGMLAKWAWGEDPNALLYLTKSEIIDGKSIEGRISVQDAEKIRDILTAVRKREQEVININGKRVPDFIRNPIVSFLYPRIVIAAQNVQDDRTIRVWDIDEILRAEREGREEPPTPLS